MPLRTTIRAFSTVFCLAAATTAAQGETTLLTNGTIYTANTAAPWADAMIIEDETIRFVGAEAEALASLSGEYRTRDLEGRFVMPGIIDAHTHPGLVAALPASDASEAGTIPSGTREEIYAWIEAYADENWYIPIVSLSGLDTAAFGPEGPHRDDLDQIFTYRPAFLMDATGHSMMMNSAAMWLLGIDEETPDIKPELSYFVRDEDGRLTGWVKEFALIPHMGDFLLPGDDELKANLHAFTQYLSRHGVTSLMDAGNFDWDDTIYTLLRELDDEGALPIRYEGIYHIYRPEQIHIAADEIKALREKYAGGNLTFNTVKIHYDGIGQVRTAGLLEPYANDPHNHGGIMFTAEELKGLMLQLAHEGINLHIHAIGDRAIRTVLNGVEQTRAELGGDLPIEIGLSHLEVAHMDDIGRFAELDVHANFTPHWFGGYFASDERQYGPVRAASIYPIRAFYDAGANVTISSDVITGEGAWRAAPFVGIQTGMTRQEPTSDASAAILQPETERVSLSQLLQGYTLNAARQLGVDGELGSLEAGKFADFIILDRNPFETDTYDIQNVAPVAVYLGGTQVQHSGTD